MAGSGMNGIPGANAMGDTLEFVKNLWGSMKIPGMAMPSMSPDEIDKQIADLKAVENWLQMNMNMLRGSIQALEVQSATLKALRSMSETFAQAASDAAAGIAPGADDKPAFDSPFASAFASPFTSASTPSAAASDDAASAAHADDSAAPSAEGTGLPFVNPAAWWSAVQDQFQQAVNQAVSQAAPPASADPSATSATGSASTRAGRSARASKSPGSDSTEKPARKTSATKKKA